LIDQFHFLFHVHLSEIGVNIEDCYFPEQPLFIVFIIFFLLPQQFYFPDLILMIVDNILKITQNCGFENCLIRILVLLGDRVGYVFCLTTVTI